MRKKIVIGNWKMYKTNKEAKAFIKIVEKSLKHTNIDYGIACSPTILITAKKYAKRMIITAQNCHYEVQGAYTGEVSIPMLNEIGVDHAVVGHSERRQYFNETDETVNKKVLALVANKVCPIICCGESLQIYEQGKTIEFVRNQISIALDKVVEQDLNSIIIAYEPIWAIGTGKVATPEIAQKICKDIRTYIGELYNGQAASRVRILYGGSVKPENIKDLLNHNDIDGALVGGASLNADDFIRIVNYNV